MTVIYILSKEAIQYHECNKYAFPEQHIMRNISLDELHITKNYDCLDELYVSHGMSMPLNEYFTFVNHYIQINHCSVDYLAELNPEYVTQYNGQFNLYEYVMDKLQVDLYVDMDERYIVYSDRYIKTIEDFLNITCLDKGIEDMEVLTSFCDEQNIAPALFELFPHLHYADISDKKTSVIFSLLEELCEMNNWDSKIYF